MSRIRADRYTNRLGTGAPLFANGVNVTGNVGVGTTVPTSKLSVIGDMNVTGTVSVGGTLTYEDVTSIDSVGIITAQAGIQVTGGSVGIGTAIPGALLSIESTAANAAKIRLGFDSPRYYDIFRGSTTNSGYLNFYGSQSSFVGYVFDGVDGERMRIDTSGRLLLGTTTEGEATADNFTIADSGHCGITLRSGDDDVGTIFFSDGTSGDAEYEGYVQYDHSGNYMKFATNHAERLRITSGGNIGVGCNDPGAMLQVSDNGDDGTFTVGGNNAGETGFNITYENGGTTYTILKQNYGATNASAYTSIHTGYFTVNTGTSFAERMRLDSSGRLMLGTTTEGYAGAQTFTIGSSGNAGITIRTGTAQNGTIAFSDATSGTAEYDGYIQYRHNTQDLVLASDGEERVRISSGGAFLLVPNTNVDTIYSSVASTGTSAAVFRGLHSATVGSPGTGTDSIYIFANGNIQNTNNSYGQISDIKLKENIVDAGSQWSDFKSVRFRKYNFKSETGHETNTQLGVVAQELELTSPGLVYETVDRDIDGNDLGTTTKGVKSSILTMKALVALQEAMARIETLETEVAALKGS